ncbi:MAG: cyclic nucleotide-binding domain-containing protein [Candidatus Celaenobacter antarcticus]|nr:cyclic nucleotide-binding domain-containing protein [Candidatus Celaenobacter antarcticus]
MNIFIRENDNELLKYLNAQELKQVEKIAKKESYTSGSFILEERDKNRDIFVIKKGSVSICFIDEDKNEKYITTLFTGETFGEINFIIPVQRTAYVKALEDVEISRFPYYELLQFLKDDISICAKICASLNDSLAKRVVRTTQEFVQALTAKDK